MDESLIKLGLRSQTVLGGIQLILVATFGGALIAFLQTTYNRDLFTCEPETNSITKQLCYDGYSSAMNQWFTPLHFVVFAYAVLVALSISFMLYGAFTLRQIRRDTRQIEKKAATFKRVYLLHVCCRLIFIAGMVGIFCGNQTLIVPKTYTCSVAAVTTPIPLNQTETDLHCHDQHYREKSISNIAIIAIKAFVLILCISEFIQVKRLTPPRKLLSKLLGEIFNDKDKDPPEEPEVKMLRSIPLQASNYIERSQVEKEIMGKLRSTGIRMLVIVALPGMGKTQVAIRVSHLLAGENRRVVFVRKQETLLDICKEILYFLYDNDEMSGDDEYIVRQATRKLSELQEDTVIVLDNTEDIQEQKDFAFENFVRTLLVSAPKVKLIITTRRNVGLDLAGIHPVHLPPMDPVSSANLLEDVFEACKEYLEEVCKVCRGVPLILINCMSLLKKGFDPKVLVEQLRNDPINHLKNNSEVCNLLGKFLHKSPRDLKKNLVLLSVFPSTFSTKDMEIVFGSSAEVQTAKAKMVTDSLLQRTVDGNYSIHPLVQAFCRKEGSSMGVGDEGDGAKRKFNQHYLKRIKILSKQFTTKDKACEAISTFRKEKANIIEAFKNCFEDTTVREDKLSAIDVANSTEVLDFLTKVFSPRKECTQLYEKCCKITRDFDDKERLADSLNSLGFQHLYLYGAAHPQADQKTLAKFEEAYNIRKALPEEKRRSKTHAHTVSKLGLCYVIQGKVEDGRQLIQEGIKIRKELRIPLYVAAGNCDLGHSYRHDNVQTAIKTWEKGALPVYRRELGEHPWTATLLHAIGDAYRDLAKKNLGENASKAERRYHEALEIQTKMLKNHLDTARSHACLSDALWMQDKLKLALEERKKALEIRERVLGPDDEKTITTREKIEELQRLYVDSRRKTSVFSLKSGNTEKGVTNKAHSELSLTSFKVFE